MGAKQHREETKKMAKQKLNLARRRMIFNHCIKSMLIYFLSCWRLPDSALTKISYGEETGGKMTKVKWSFCIVWNELDGPVIKNLKELTDRMAAKWIFKGLQQLNKACAKLLFGGKKKNYGKR